MDKSYEKKYHTLEEDHPWFVARRNIIKYFVRRLPLSAKILEIGSSGGILIQELRDLGYNHITGIDSSPEAVERCIKRGLNQVFLMDGKNPKFEDPSFDLIIASDVLEHIDDDLFAVNRWRELLKDGGKIICFVPAFNFLWSGHDIASNHYRRYTQKRLLGLFNKNKFNILRSSYWNFFLFIPILLFNFKKSLFFSGRTQRDNLYQLPRPLGYFLGIVLNIENKILRHINLPVGVSVFVIAEKS